MKYCPNCGAQVEDYAASCPLCGSNFAPYTGAPAFDPSDHTAEYSAQEISEQKLPSVLAYLLGPIGMIVALLFSPNSDLVRFHVREAMKLLVCELLLTLATSLLFWTVIVGIIGGIALLALAVVEIICVVRVLQGKVTNAPLVDKIAFLK